MKKKFLINVLLILSIVLTDCNSINSNLLLINFKEIRDDFNLIKSKINEKDFIILQIEADALSQKTQSTKVVQYLLIPEKNEVVNNKKSIWSFKVKKYSNYRTFPKAVKAIDTEFIINMLNSNQDVTLDCLKKITPVNDFEFWISLNGQETYISSLDLIQAKPLTYLKYVAIYNALKLILFEEEFE